MEGIMYTMVWDSKYHTCIYVAWKMPKLGLWIIAGSILGGLPPTRMIKLMLTLKQRNFLEKATIKMYTSGQNSLAYDFQTDKGHRKTALHG